MISSTALQAFSVATDAAAPRRMPGGFAGAGGVAASPGSVDGGGFSGGWTLPDLPPGRILPRGSLLDISV